MQKFSLGFISIIVMAFVSCSGSNNDNAKNKQATGTKPSQTLNGTFSGTLPCADCAGIETSLAFKAQGKVYKTNFYEDSDADTMKVAGTYTINQDTVEVNVKKRQEFYLITSDTSIAMLNHNKKKIIGALASHYILTESKR